MREFARQWAVLEVKNTRTFVQETFIFSRSQVHATAKITGVAVEWPLLHMFVVRGGQFYWNAPAYVNAAKVRYEVRNRAFPDARLREF